MQTLTTGCNKLSPPKNGTPDRSCTHLAVSFRLYVHIYVAAVTLKSSTWKLLRGGFCAHALSLSLSLSCISSTVLTYTFCVLLTYTYFCAPYVYVLTSTFFVFPSPVPLTYTYLHIRFCSLYVYVLTYTYLRRRTYVEVRLEKKFLQNFFPSGLQGVLGIFLENFLAPYYVEYTT